MPLTETDSMFPVESIALISSESNRPLAIAFFIALTEIKPCSKFSFLPFERSHLCIGKALLFCLNSLYVFLAGPNFSASLFRVSSSSERTISFVFLLLELLG
jgi:hypothetical protein